MRSDFIHPWSSPEWRGLTAGIFGGTIGVLPSICAAILDHKNFGIKEQALGPTKAEHIAYLKWRGVIGTSSGFVLAAIVGSLPIHVTTACLTAIGLVGGFSVNFLPALSKTVDNALAKRLGGMDAGDDKSNSNQGDAKQAD